MFPFALALALGGVVPAFSAPATQLDRQNTFRRVMKRVESLHLKGPLETGAIQRMGVLPGLHGDFRPEVSEGKDGMLDVRPAADGVRITIPGSPYSYIEQPNSTALKYRNPETGEYDEFMITRAIREYVNHVKTDGTQSPEGYISDLVKRKKDPKTGRFGDPSVLLYSTLEHKIAIEDGRLFSVFHDDGTASHLLGVTDYSFHVPVARKQSWFARWMAKWIAAGKPMEDLSVVNRFMEIKYEKGDLSVANFKEEKHTGRMKPRYVSMSPEPEVLANGDILFTDGKNGHITRNAFGQYVLRMRLRLDSKNSHLQRIFHGKPIAHYGEQYMIFDTFEDTLAYMSSGMKYAFRDIYGTPAKVKPSRPLPREAGVLMEDTDLLPTLHDPRVIPGKVGFGPSTPPVQFFRQGEHLYTSEGLGITQKELDSGIELTPAVLAERDIQDHGVIDPSEREHFALTDGQISYFGFDHEIAYYKDIPGYKGTETSAEVAAAEGMTRRFYGLTVKRLNNRLNKIEEVYSYAIQPKEDYERGFNSGILELDHAAYIMGKIIRRDESGKWVISLIGGVSDAHTAQYDVNPMKLMYEFGAKSARRESGQIYPINR